MREFKRMSRMDFLMKHFQIVPSLEALRVEAELRFGGAQVGTITITDDPFGHELIFYAEVLQNTKSDSIAGMANSSTTG